MQEVLGTKLYLGNRLADIPPERSRGDCVASNKDLNKANKAKKDEFYTMLADIEVELKHYRKHFKGKTVLCNCDDPFESNFFKYFAMNFNYLGLKKLKAVEVLKAQKEKTDDEYVFPSPNGGPISPDSVNNMLHRVLDRAGIPRVRFHDMRHTFATLALQNGVDIKTVSGMLGHFSAGFTLDTYAHVTTAAQKEAAETMGNILAQSL